LPYNKVPQYWGRKEKTGEGGRFFKKKILEGLRKCFEIQNGVLPNDSTVFSGKYIGRSLPLNLTRYWSLCNLCFCPLIVCNLEFLLDSLTCFNDGALPSNTVTSNVKFVIESFFFQINLFPNPFLYLCRLKWSFDVKIKQIRPENQSFFFKKRNGEDD